LSDINKKKMEDRAAGVLLGSAVGDALGGPVEFMTAGQIKRKYGVFKEMTGGVVGNGHHVLKPGEFTDDTDMALCIAESLVEMRGYVPEDIARRFVEWYKTDPKDIGNTTRLALRRLSQGASFRDSGLPEGMANGSLMRCAPLSLMYPRNEDSLIDVSMEVSAMTHAHPEAKMSCVLVNLMIAKMLLGADRNRAYNSALEKVRQMGREFVRVYLTSGYQPDPAKGLAVNTLLLSLDCFMKSNSFEEAVIGAVNLGGDADTTGAVTGALAGAYFGAANIPERWYSKLNPKPAEHFIGLAKTLYKREVL
jgi:ADP-ribosyl-[dinitrogen reductase] hydrolase